MSESISEPPQKLPISQLHTYSANSFFIFPSSTDEVAQLIENLNDKKTVRSNDVEIRFIKYSKSIISPITQLNKKYFFLFAIDLSTIL